MASIYMCPVCQLGLDRLERRFACANGHSFDIAKEGYVNLLLAQHKKTAAPGDSKAMVDSRRAFLAAGHYDRLSDALNQTILDTLGDTAPDDALQLLDAGCGEGFYLWKLSQSLSAQGLSDEIGLWGVDISKTAISQAAKRDRSSRFAVASSYRLPVLPNCLDAILNIFAPASSQEFCRILKPGGIRLSLHPGPRHLAALKALIYATPKEHPAAPEVPAGFTRLDQMRVAYDLHLQDAADIGHLVAMTPYYWHMDPSRQERVLSITALETAVDFSLTLDRKDGV